MYVRQAKVSSSSLFEGLVDQHKGAVHAVAYSTTGDAELSKDIAQEAFLQAWQTQDQLRDSTRFRSWVCGIARNLARQSQRSEYRRRRRNRKSIVGEQKQVPSLLSKRIEKEDRELIYRSLSELSLPYREVCVLYYSEGQSVRAVASALNISEVTVAKRLSRARKELKKDIEHKLSRHLQGLSPGLGFTSSLLAKASALSVGTSTLPFHWIIIVMKLKYVILILVSFALIFGLSRSILDHHVSQDSTHLDSAMNPNSSLSEKKVSLLEVLRDKTNKVNRVVSRGAEDEKTSKDLSEERPAYHYGYEFSGDKKSTLFYGLTDVWSECSPPMVLNEEAKMEMDLSFSASDLLTKIEYAKIVSPEKYEGSREYEKCVMEKSRGLTFAHGLKKERVIIRVLKVPGFVEKGSVSKEEALEKDRQWVAQLAVHTGESLGPDNAKVSIAVYTDFQCSYCAKMLATLDELREEFPDDLRVVVKLFPLHESSTFLSAATVAAGEQGKFWQMHDLLFAYQDTSLVDDTLVEKLALQIGLNIEKFRKDMASETTLAIVDDQISEGKAMGVRGTPTSFINNTRLMGAQPMEVIRALIEKELEK